MENEKKLNFVEYLLCVSILIEYLHVYYFI